MLERAESASVAGLVTAAEAGDAAAARALREHLDRRATAAQLATPEGLYERFVAEPDSFDAVIPCKTS